jgi:DNA replication and repair protein RecF
LDDVMSELDARRRGMLLAVLGKVEQAVVTTTDWNDFSPAFLTQAQLLQVENGEVRHAAPEEVLPQSE